MEKKRKVFSDVKLDEEGCHKDELSDQHYTGMNFLEDVVVGLVAECGEYDIALTACGYNIGGKVWGVDDAMLPQTFFMAVPHNQQGIRDNPFISHRIDAVRPTTFEVQRKEDRIIKQVGNRRFIARPPYWELTGEHMGVESNLILSGMGPANWHLGKWSDVGKNGRGGYNQLCWAEGNVKASGKTYSIETGYAIQGHELVSEAWSKPVEGNHAIQYFYYVFFSEELQIAVYLRPAAGSIYGRVVVDGKETHFGWGEIALDELEWWVDPKTGMRVPVRWHVNLSAAGGMLDVNLAAYGRAVYGFFQSFGYKLHYNYLARSNGSYLQVGGRKIPLDDGGLTIVEWGLTTPLGLPV